MSETNVHLIDAGWMGEGKPYLDSQKLKALRSFWEKLFALKRQRGKGPGNARVPRTRPPFPRALKGQRALLLA